MTILNLYMDREKLMTLLRHFYVLTGMRIVVFDDAFQEVACYPNHHSRYCNVLRQSAAAIEKCALCDKEACTKSKKYKELVTYRCHAGLVEAVTPICHENLVIGYIMLGQMLQTDDYDRSWQELEPYLSGFDVPLQELKAAYYKKKNMPPEVIVSAAKIMEACSAHLYLSKMLVLRDDSLARRLDKYIGDNLKNDLSTETLCGTFGISRNRLYEMAAHCYGRGIAEHIRGLRMENARRLLADNDRKIYEVAEECGFPDYNYFTKVFKSHFGVTPREFRKQGKMKLQEES